MKEERLYLFCDPCIYIYIYVYIHMLDLCWKGWNGRFGPLPAFSKKLVAVMVESLLIPGLAYQFWVEMFNFSKIHLLLKEGYPSVQQSIRVTVKFIASWVWEKLKVPAQSSHLGCKTWGNVAQNGVLPKVDVRIETERRSVDPPILIQNRETRNNTHAQWEACPLEKSSPYISWTAKTMHWIRWLMTHGSKFLSSWLAICCHEAHTKEIHTWGIASEPTKLPLIYGILWGTWCSNKPIKKYKIIKKKLHVRLHVNHVIYRIPIITQELGI